MAHYKFTGGGRIKSAQNWTFQTNPYITARPQIHCVGDECKRSDINVYYQYGGMETNPPVFLHYIPMIIVIILVLVIGGIFLYRRWQENRRYEETAKSRMDYLAVREYVDSF